MTRSNSKSLAVIATFTRLSHNRATLNSPRPATLPTPESRDESCCGALVGFAAGVDTDVLSLSSTPVRASLPNTVSMNTRPSTISLTMARSQRGTLPRTWGDVRPHSSCCPVPPTVFAGDARHVYIATLLQWPRTLVALLPPSRGRGSFRSAMSRRPRAPDRESDNANRPAACDS